MKAFLQCVWMVISATSFLSVLEARADLIFECRIDGVAGSNVRLPVDKLTCASVVDYCDLNVSTSEDVTCVSLGRNCNILKGRTSCRKRYDEKDVPAGYTRGGAGAIGSILLDSYVKRGCYLPNGDALANGTIDAITGLPSVTVVHHLYCVRN
jgi:hypothetical protein